MEKWIAALGLASIAPALALAAWLSRRTAVTGASPGDEIDEWHRARRALWAVRFARAHIGVFGSYLAVLWYCQFAELIDALSMLVVCSSGIASALATLPWLRRRETALLDLIETCRERVADQKRTAWDATR